MQANKYRDFPRGKRVVGHAAPRAPRVVRSLRRAARPDRGLSRRRRLAFLMGWTGGVALASISTWLFQTGGTLCGALGMLTLQLGGASIILGVVCSDAEGDE